MKKFIFIYFLFLSFCYADYTVSGSGDSRGEAYIDAMSKSPSGQHWELNKIHYSPDGNTCIIIWKIKK